MRPYRDETGNGGITHFYAYPGGIRVRYQGGKLFDFTHQTCDAGSIETMTRLAQAGSGLSGWIAKYKPRHKGSPK